MGKENSKETIVENPISGKTVKRKLACMMGKEVESRNTHVLKPEQKDS